MTRRLLLLLFLVLPLGCRSTSTSGSRGVGHVVVFELSDPSASKPLGDALTELLQNTPGVLDFHIGPRADIAVREGKTDTAFDLLLWTRFQDADAYRAYLMSKPHLALIDRFSASIRSVRVFDASAQP